jgi:hypothetical protein
MKPKNYSNIKNETKTLSRVSEKITISKLKIFQNPGLTTTVKMFFRKEIEDGVYLFYMKH